MYRYFGIHWGCKLAVSITLLWAHVPSAGHTAAWLGAQTPDAQHWVQGGVAESDGKTFVYIEWQGAGYGIRVVPWSTHRPDRVILQHRGSLWRAGAGYVWTPWVYLKHAVHCSVLELLNGAHGAAMIARRNIRA